MKNTVMMSLMALVLLSAASTAGAAEIQFNAYQRRAHTPHAAPSSIEVRRIYEDVKQACESFQAQMDVRVQALGIPGLTASTQVKAQPVLERRYRSYRCIVTISLDDAAPYELRESVSEELDHRSDCEAIASRNEQDRSLVYQALRSGWTLFQGNWCNVHVIELITR